MQTLKPPWSYKDKAIAGKRGVEFKYPTMTIEDICALPVNQITADNCALFLWITMPNLFLAKEVIDAWGFTYKTCAFTWIKKTKNNKLVWGMGSYTRANPELCLLATKGKLKRLSAGVHSVIEAIPGRHSEKPAIVRDKIVELFGDLPRVELFARERITGWTSWGNEI